ncbi:MAG: D-glycero-beta-D-manno-heptose 1,7-bisphosphate 7-phosphatase [Burkholderiaceae bacterium]|jgi:D-glycero-D-manno-heptose 1,7-bisphosphate phosphatase
MQTPKKLVILDRDGVINFDSDEYIKSPAEWRPIPGSLEAIARLNQHGYQIAIATNQTAVARGLIDMRMLNSIHQKLHLSALAVGAHINAIFFCPHAADEFCDCRKPRPGMLTAIGKRFGINLRGVPMVGDALRDMQAAFEVGCSPYLVRTGKGEKTLQTGGLPPGTQVFSNLASVVEQLLQTAHLASETTELARSALTAKR